MRSLNSNLRFGPLSIQGHSRGHSSAGTAEPQVSLINSGQISHFPQPHLAQLFLLFASQGTVQSATSRPGTRENSRTLFVTTVPLAARTVAAIHKSASLIAVPCASR